MLKPDCGAGRRTKAGSLGGGRSFWGWTRSNSDDAWRYSGPNGAVVSPESVKVRGDDLLVA